MGEDSLYVAFRSHKFSAGKRKVEEIDFHLKLYLSLKDVLVHCSGGAFCGLFSHKTRSVEELLALFSFGEDSIHTEVFYQVVETREPLRRVRFKKITI